MSIATKKELDYAVALWNLVCSGRGTYNDGARWNALPRELRETVKNQLKIPGIESDTKPEEPMFDKDKQEAVRGITALIGKIDEALKDTKQLGWLFDDSRLPDTKKRYTAWLEARCVQGWLREERKLLKNQLNELIGGD